MSARQRFLDTVRKYQGPPERPADPKQVSWCPELEMISRDRLLAIQSEKLAAAFDYLWECSPFYRERFERAGLGPGAIRSVADLPKIPVTRKLDWIEDIERNPPYGTFSPLSTSHFRDDAWMLFSTSGTTRQPRVFRHTNHDREMWSLMCARALWSYGVRPGDVALNCFFYGPAVAAWGMHFGLNRIGAGVIPGGAIPNDRRAMFVQMLRPQVLLGTPSTLINLGQRMIENGDDPAKVGVKTLVMAGEPGPGVPATKRRLETMWGGAQAHDDFGCTEAAMAPLGYTCEYEVTKAEGLVGTHLMEDALIVEVLHPETLEPVPLGEKGTLVVSNLYSESSPFLRFDMGDWVVVDEKPCGCGRTHARAVGGLLGRNDHCLKIKGIQFFPSTFEDAVRSLKGIGDEYRIEVYTAAHVAKGGSGPSPADIGHDAVRILIERGAEPLKASDLAERLRGILGISVEVELVDPGSLGRVEGLPTATSTWKGTRFVDKRAKR